MTGPNPGEVKDLWWAAWLPSSGQKGACHDGIPGPNIEMRGLRSGVHLYGWEQLFFHDKQFKNEPKRCKPCKSKRVATLGVGMPASLGSVSSISRVETRTVCSQCGKETTVPFKPTQGRPVFCRECFQQRRVSAATA